MKRQMFPIYPSDQSIVESEEEECEKSVATQTVTASIWLTCP